MTLLLIHAAATWFLVGLIWTIQLVHYPLFARVGADGFTVYEREHARRITWIVAPAMALEAVTAVLLLLAPVPVSGMAEGRLVLLGAVGLLAVVWVSTALIQVPCHGRLSRGFDPDAHRRLVQSNWVRTVAWTARGALVSLLLAGGSPSPG